MAAAFNFDDSGAPSARSENDRTAAHRVTEWKSRRRSGFNARRPVCQDALNHSGVDPRQSWGLTIVTLCHHSADESAVTVASRAPAESTAVAEMSAGENTVHS